MIFKKEKIEKGIVKLPIAFNAKTELGQSYVHGKIFTDDFAPRGGVCGGFICREERGDGAHAHLHDAGEVYLWPP